MGVVGGELSAPQLVSEQYLLDLEREAFVSLCGERKTQERIAHTLKPASRYGIRSGATARRRLAPQFFDVELFVVDSHRVCLF